MIASPSRVEGVLLDPADAAYIATAIVEFGKLAAAQGATLTPRIQALRDTLTAASRVATDAGARDSVSSHNYGLPSAHDRLLTSAEAARVLGCTAGNIRDLVRRGSIHAVRAGSIWLLDADAVEQRARDRRTG